MKHIVFLLLLFITGDMCGMELQLKKNFLEKLERDAQIEDFKYTPKYFKDIAKEINNEYQILEFHPESLDLLEKYEHQLDIHAHKYIKQLINSSYSSEQKKKELEKYFSKNDPVLQGYYWEGLPKITVQTIGKLERSDIKQIGKLGELEQRMIVLELKHKEQEKKKLLAQIIEYNPGLSQHERALDFSIYTSQYFRDQTNEQQRTKDAIAYIKYVVSNDDIPVGAKLQQIETVLGEDTQRYLEATLQSIIVTIITIKPREEELPKEEAGFVEEVSPEEEERMPKEIRPEITVLEQQPKMEQKKAQLGEQTSATKATRQQPTKQQPEEVPAENIVIRTVKYVWNGISNFLSNIYHGFAYLYTEFWGRAEEE